MLSQVTFSFQKSASLTDSEKLEIGRDCIEICKSLKLTGRAFVKKGKAANIVEGPHDNLVQLLAAMENDPRITALEINNQRKIKTRDFADYLIGFECLTSARSNEAIFQLTRDSFLASLPDTLSPSRKIMITTYVFDYNQAA